MFKPNVSFMNGNNNLLSHTLLVRIFTNRKFTEKDYSLLDYNYCFQNCMFQLGLKQCLVAYFGNIIPIGKRNDLDHVSPNEKYLLVAKENSRLLTDVCSRLIIN